MISAKVVMALCLSLVLNTVSGIPFLSKSYTPFVFFKVPPGLIPECDDMEEAVKKVEKELGVRVERLDVLRCPAAEATLALLTQKTPPFLYHRESCQVVHVPAKGKVNYNRVKAWAKGRYLTPIKQVDKVATPTVISQEQKSIDQSDLEDMMLTPLQRKGKQAIKERTEQATEKTQSRPVDS